MSEHRSRIQMVYTDAGTHMRIVGNNGEPVWYTEPYNDDATALDALGLLPGTTIYTSDDTGSKTAHISGEVYSLELIDEREGDVLVADDPEAPDMSEVDRTETRYENDLG